MEKNLRELLEYRSQGQSVDVAYVKQLAYDDPDFARAWLIHAIGSDSSVQEISFALDAAEHHQLKELADLHQFCRYSSVETTQVFSDDPDYFKEQILTSLKSWQHTYAEQHQHVTVFHSSLQISAYIQRLTELEVAMSMAKVHAKTDTNQLVTQVRNNTQFPVGSPASKIEWAALERLISVVSSQSLRFAEPLMIYRYKVGEEYRWHCDWIPDHLPQNQLELSHFGNRARTAILCLQDAYTGGETAFKVWAEQYKSKIGQVIMFDNLKPDGTPDFDSVHCGKPVTSGEKWIATLWFRQKALWFRNSLF